MRIFYDDSRIAGNWEGEKPFLSDRAGQNPLRVDIVRSVRTDDGAAQAASLVQKESFLAGKQRPVGGGLARLPEEGALLQVFPPKTSSWCFTKTCVSGGTERVIQTLPPITERAPITVSPPRTVALA
jgi:hypothetical protein